MCSSHPETRFHVMCECTSARASLWREESTASLRYLVGTLLTHGARILARAGCTPATVTTAASATTHAYLSGADLQPHERDFILYWVLCGTPWPQYVTAVPLHLPQYPIAHVLGALFDALNVRHGLLRPWAALWLRWSESRLRLLGDVLTSVNASDNDDSEQ